MPPPIEVDAQPGLPLGMTPQAFLRDYWQKQPLLIRGAFANFEAPLSPDDLGGLSLEESALSRLIVHDPEADTWQVRSGPFDEATFEQLPEDHWTLLVQDVDKWDADVAQMLADFRFLPGWRVDDIMISYAEDGGGVGAHVDQYDVFLLQGLGQRRWAIDASPNPPLECRDDVELKLLRQFNATHSWTLDTGDMLYLPPGVPHDGVGIGQGMTFSVGMRAPARAELLLDASEYLAEHMDEADRYTDPDLAPAERAGEIDAAALDRVARSLGPMAEAMGRERMADWFGRFITRYRSAQFAAPPPQPISIESLSTALDQGAALLRHPWSRLAWCQTESGATLFAGGHAMACPPELAQALCGDTPLQAAIAPGRREREVLTALVNEGHLALEQAH
ncbi:cupin domain-containing protein [Oleiagrimonas sp. C23AA]|uniref:cupin domain-containing protein n=1 Tax=Oleiagrimonas sp. C23AA TaxID=2719047 RepID=UPI001F0EA910|nr:cupin domain-containing protein [Oleiagrimonas sp. C23AA]